MFCPKKFNSNSLDNDGVLTAGSCQCEQSKCAWWNERFGMCCIAVDAHLKATEDIRLEREINRRGG